MNELWVIGFTGALVGSAIGWPLLRVRGVTNDVTAGSLRLIGGLLMGGAMATAIIAANHGQLPPPSLALSLEHVVSASDLIFWSIFTIWIRHSTGLRMSTTAAALLIGVPLIAYAAYAVPTQTPPRFLWLLPAGAIASTYGLARWMQTGGDRTHSIGDRLRTRVVLFATAICLAQAVRTFWPHVIALREIVPITMTVGFVSIAALAMRGLWSDASDGSADRGSLRPYARSTLDEASATALLASLESGMRDEAWYRDRELSLRSVADKLHTTPHAISQALNQTGGQSLPEYLAVWRVADARRLLLDPASDRFTIDALAESAGFGSRAAFYKTFKTVEGMTPTEFRKRARSGRGSRVRTHQAD